MDMYIFFKCIRFLWSQTKKESYTQRAGEEKRLCLYHTFPFCFQSENHKMLSQKAWVLWKTHVSYTLRPLSFSQPEGSTPLKFHLFEFFSNCLQGASQWKSGEKKLITHTMEVPTHSLSNPTVYFLRCQACDFFSPHLGINVGILSVRVARSWGFLLTIWSPSSYRQS